MRGIVDLNGRLIAAARAQISAFDRGFLFGDGLFETIRCYRGRPFALDHHLARLERSSRFLGIALPPTNWEKRITAVLRRNRLLGVDTRVRISISRGAGPPTLAPPPGLRPTVMISAARIDPSLARLQYHGGRVVLLPYMRQGFLAEHKTTGYLPAVLAQAIIARHGAAEGVYVTAKGHIVEGTTSNFFVVRGNRLLTPPPGEILDGVTRHYVLALAAATRLRAAERPVPVTSLSRCDEAFLTSAVVEILPVTRIGHTRVGSGRVGTVTRRLQRLYRLLVAEKLRADAA